MRLHTAATSLLLASTSTTVVRGFSAVQNSSIQVRDAECSSSPASFVRKHDTALSSSVVEDATEVMEVTEFAVKNEMKFRDLQKACRSMGLEATGSTAMLKARLLEAIGVTKVNGSDENVS